LERSDNVEHRTSEVQYGAKDLEGKPLYTLSYQFSGWDICVSPGILPGLCRISARDYLSNSSIMRSASVTLNAAFLM
jgi:hypothetical protein